MYIQDTICAIATPLGMGALAIVRASGPDAIKIVNSVFKGKDLTKVKKGSIFYGHIINNQQIVDEVIVTIFHNPNSFTGEDLVEITTHGGILVTQSVLETLLSNGCRLAEPGEFTKRAFLNQKIDLIQAEAIMDIIEASNETALKIAHQSLNKQTSKLIEKLLNQLLSMIGSVEVSIDYPEYDDEQSLIPQERFATEVANLLDEINHVISNSKKSKLINKGVNTAIIGKPNVGKSSLLNALIGQDRAIVSNIAGTTRDTIDVSINLSGITLNLIDTAGIRDSVDEIEKIGIKRSIDACRDADLVLLVIDASKPLDANDHNLIDLTKDKVRIIIANKIDIDVVATAKDYMYVSAISNQGIKELEGKIISILKLDNVGKKDFNYLSNARHIAKLREAKKHLNLAYNALQQNVAIDLVLIDLTNAYTLLGDILGINSYNNLLDELFSKFCLGK